MKFKLAGDKGKGVPKINFDSLKVTIAVTVRMSLAFDVKAQLWTCPPRNFRIEVISFKGPYGINRRCADLPIGFVIISHSLSCPAWWAWCSRWSPP